MGDTKIEWAMKSWNPMTGCTKISPGCKNCYACRMSKRLVGRAGYPADDPFRVTLHPDRLEQPLHWKNPRRVFVASMGDLFHEDVPFEFILGVFSIIERCPQHTFIILTKRPEGAREFFDEVAIDNSDVGLSGWNILLDCLNIYLGVTAENQEQADKRIPILLTIPAAVRFVSVEPMLEGIDLLKMQPNHYTLINSLEGCETAFRGMSMEPSSDYTGKKLDWVICGGESGSGARPMHPDWARSLRDQCVEAGISYFFKQWGEYQEIYRFNSFLHWVNKASTHVDRNCICLGSKGTVCRTGKDFAAHQFPVVVMRKVGKKAAGRELDGQTWSEFPNV